MSDLQEPSVALVGERAEGFPFDKAFPEAWAKFRREEHDDGIIAAAVAIHLAKDDADASDLAEAAITAYVGKISDQPQIQLPADIVESILKVGRVEWGATPAQTDEEHVSDFARTLRLTREYFGISDETTQLHGIYLEGDDTVVAHTGTSPNSPQHARILAGAWNQLVDIASASKADD